MSSKNQSAMELGFIGRSAYVVGSKGWTTAQKVHALGVQGEGADETCNHLELRGVLENGQEIVLRGQLKESKGENGGVSASLNIMVVDSEGGYKGRVDLTPDLLRRARTAASKKEPKNKTTQTPADDQFASIFGSQAPAAE